MRIAYCEDEKAQYVYLKELTDRWEMKTGIACNIAVYGSAEEMLFENQRSFSFDVILLDIELDRMNGIELARCIRQVDKKVILAFLSNSREYVFEGYEVGAVRYLLKPISESQLFPLLELARESMKKEKQYLILEAAGEKVKVWVEDILFVETLGHYVSIHTRDKIFEIKKSLNELSKTLSQGFLISHRSYLVNLAFVERVTRTDCILEGGWKVPISRSMYKTVNEAFIAYYKGGEPV